MIIIIIDNNINADYSELVNYAHVEETELAEAYPINKLDDFDIPLIEDYVNFINNPIIINLFVLIWYYDNNNVGFVRSDKEKDYG